jgi:hypothetical protein
MPQLTTSALPMKLSGKDLEGRNTSTMEEVLKANSDLRHQIRQVQAEKKALEEKVVLLTLNQTPQEEEQNNGLEGSVVFRSAEIIHYADTVDLVQAALQPWLLSAQIYSEEKVKSSEDSRRCTGKRPLVLGLDCEWRPTFKAGMPQNKVATLQLSDGKVAVVVHLTKLCQDGGKNELPPTLLSLLADTSVLKVGVGIKGDVARLLSDRNLVVRGAQDLEHFVKMVPFPHCTIPKLVSLKKLVHIFGCHTLPKSKSVQLSNWDTIPLTDAQQRYAADDATAGCFVYYAVQYYISPVVPIRELDQLYQRASVVYPLKQAPARKKTPEIS